MNTWRIENYAINFMECACASEEKSQMRPKRWQLNFPWVRRAHPCMTRAGPIKKEALNMTAALLVQGTISLSQMQQLGVTLLWNIRTSYKIVIQRNNVGYKHEIGVTRKIIRCQINPFTDLLIFILFVLDMKHF